MGEEAGRRLGMPLNAFTEEAYKELAAGNDQMSLAALDRQRLSMKSLTSGGLHSIHLPS